MQSYQGIALSGGGTSLSLFQACTKGFLPSPLAQECRNPDMAIIIIMMTQRNLLGGRQSQGPVDPIPLYSMQIMSCAERRVPLDLPPLKRFVFSKSSFKPT